MKKLVILAAIMAATTIFTACANEAATNDNVLAAESVTNNGTWHRKNDSLINDYRHAVAISWRHKNNILTHYWCLVMHPIFLSF